MVVVVWLLIPLAQAAQDPTAPLGWQAPAVKTSPSRARLPQLQGIFCDQDGQACRAILNSVSVGTGGRISGYTLSQVTDDYVILQRGGRQWRLEMFADNIKSE
ncbi:MSHA biogenesis protein MshK [Photobacterium gaetbulicola]|uniref:MSHA biogenesis protein MshK n=2 Tax=Vibrionaceae TaxID=641 RepID=A0A0C5W771_9GAMM|nr:MSHA biogenesis protein MshK [Photobacterium gaetbulicola Gung47]PSU03073.1 MSHA biogenesis protein MshK [Photobacterium gaetbulicola]